MKVFTRRSRGARVRPLLVGAACAGLGTLAVAPLGGQASGGLTFSAGYVSTTLGGGEPFVIYSHGSNDLVYSAHEGTTHIDKNYVATPGSSCDIKPETGFLCSYNNQINIWYSTDGGNTWTKSPGNPAYTGFSDPSLTEDLGNNIYDTGIDLANDA
ncbi:MAG: glycoside hydrolase family 32 protein, partial [Chloroflexi bacterium]